MSPEIAKKQKHTKNTDVWSLGLVFIDLILMDFHKLDNPTGFTVSDPDLQALDKCIRDKMVVIDKESRAYIEQVIKDKAFSKHIQIVEAKAKAWQFEEALHETEIHHLQQQISELRQTIADNAKQFSKDLASRDKQNVRLEACFNRQIADLKESSKRYLDSWVESTESKIRRIEDRNEDLELKLQSFEVVGNSQSNDNQTELEANKASKSVGKTLSGPQSSKNQKVCNFFMSLIS